MTYEKRLNLALACLLVFYVFYIVWETLLGTMCGQLAVDYCDFWSAGKVANTYGYAKIYDQQLLDQAEKGLLPATADPSTFAVNPFPYLPVFVMPFQLLSLLEPKFGLWIWTVINLVALWMYLQFFAKSLNKQSTPTRLLVIILASLPVFNNVFTGQVDVWLTICVGEFMRALLNRKPLRAGIWLAGLLLKPQVLVLIGLVFLLRRSFRLLAGLTAASSALLATSVALIGPSGIIQMVKLWLGYSKGEAANWIEGMMNWRMVGLHVSNITNPWIGWGITGAGMLTTLIITIYVWKQPRGLGWPSQATTLLGILAATTLFAWHAHIHTAMIMIPPLIYLYQAKLIPEKVIGHWVLLPALLQVLAIFIPEGAMKLSMPYEAAYLLSAFLPGAGQFLVNLQLFSWAARVSVRAV